MVVLLTRLRVKVTFEMIFYYKPNNVVLITEIDEVWQLTFHQGSERMEVLKGDNFIIKTVLVREHMEQVSEIVIENYN